ncbi:MAG: adenylate/guanylate cyclase domain-containing protein [Myxococcaceae bacterium]|nr:adenylate/guanylate cyclase domain-containing protein [Myxococcaceae bacterium]
MAGTPIQSAGRRFIRKFGVSFAWALLFSGVLGGAVFFRVPRAANGETLTWHAEVRQWLERLELVTYDWRARALGDASQRSDDVVLLALDDETLANAREGNDLSLSVRPWPREVLGGLMQQALKEGATQVLLDLPLTDTSPRQCGGKGDLFSADDEALRRRLDQEPGKMMLGFKVLERAPRSADRELKPFLLKVGEHPNEADARENVRRVLAARAPAHLVPKGQGFELWAAAFSEARARDLAQALELRGSPVIRPENADDRRYEVDAQWLVEALAEVEVEGADALKLPVLRGVEAPVPAALSAQALLGTTNLERDPDGRVRAVPLLWKSTSSGRTRVLPSAALRAAMRSLGVTKVVVRDGRLQLGKVSVPVDWEGYLAVRWDTAEVGRGPRGTLKRSVPLWRLAVNMSDAGGVKHHDNELEGRVAILTDASGAALPTPVGDVQPGAVLAQAFNNLLAGTAVERVPPELDFYAVVAMAFAGAFVAVSLSSLFRRAGGLSMAFVLVAVCVAYGFIARQVFVSQGRWVVVAAPLLAFGFTYLASLGYATALERTVREMMGRALGRALPTEIAARLESNVSLMRPERRAIAVYISDIDGFTRLAHELEPETYVSVLQEYLARMTRAVLDTKGNVDKYLGDGVMAFWGAPVHLENPAAVACEAALQMGTQFEKRRVAWEKRCHKPMAFRAGLDFGEALVGEMGTEHRMTYTVMGEPVATAARLESLARKWDVRMLVTEAVVDAAGEKYTFREIDVVRLPRREKPVKVYELVGRSADLDAPRLERLQKYGAALGAYQARRFKEARHLFMAMNEDEAIKRYVARAAKYEEKPPPESWDGVFEPAEA